MTPYFKVIKIYWERVIAVQPESMSGSGSSATPANMTPLKFMSERLSANNLLVKCVYMLKHIKKFYLI